MRFIRTIDTIPDNDEDAEESVGKRYWHWYEVGNEGGKSSKLPVTWDVHVGDVVKQATAIVANLPLDPQLKDAVIFAAKFHDHGKRRRQSHKLVLGNFNYPSGGTRKIRQEKAVASPNCIVTSTALFSICDANRNSTT